MSKMDESVFIAQSDIIISEVATTGPSTDEEDLEDVGRNAGKCMYLACFK